MSDEAIHNRVAYLYGAKIGAIYGNNYFAIDNAGNVTFHGSASMPASVKGGVDLITASLKGTVALDTFPFNTVTLTEAAAAFAKVHDISDAFYNLSTSSSGAGYTNNYQLFPDTEAENDAAYFGDPAKFGALYFDMSATVAVYGADSITWEYWDGTAQAWITLSIIWDNTDADDGDGDRPFQQDGYVIFNAPPTWGASVIDGQSAYWIRARVVSGFNITTIPLTNSKEHQIPSDANASEIPYGCTISRCRFNWDAVSTGTADTKLVFYNFTTGAAKSLTITKALRDYAIADVAITIDANQEFGWYVSQVDGGGTEYADGSVEMKVTRT